MRLPRGGNKPTRPSLPGCSTTSARVVGPLRASCGDLPADPHAGFAADAFDVLAEGDRRAWQRRGY